MGARANWVTERPRGYTTEFFVKQRRSEPLPLVLVVAAVLLSVLVASALVVKYGGAVLTVLGSAFGLASFAGCCALAGLSLLLIPRWLFGKSETAFRLEPEFIELLKKYRNGYPDLIARDEVSACFFMPPTGRRRSYAPRCSVGIRHRGSEVVLAGLLDEGEAEFLFRRIELALAKNRDAAPYETAANGA